MKYERTPRFDSDYKNLPRAHRKQFLDLRGPFSAAFDSYVNDPGGFTWPASLRVTRMTSVKGIWEVTWSFASPDGRATSELVTVEGEARVRWRRIGDHRVHQQP